MSLYVVIEILNDDGSETRDGIEFDIDTLARMNQDREDGYLKLDGPVYAIPVRVKGIIRGDRLDDASAAIEDLPEPS